MYGDLPVVKDTAGNDVSGFPYPIPSSPTGPKFCLLRLPEPTEMMSYLGSLKTRVKHLGNRKSKAEDVPNPAAVLKLFKAIRLDTNGPDFDADEAQAALDSLTLYRIKSSERTGEQHYTIVLRTMFGDVSHVLRIPYKSEQAEYNRTSYDSTTLPYGVEERRYPPQVPCDLYDKVFVSRDGYADKTPTPPNHKRGAIIELINQLDSLDPDLDPNS